MKFALALIGAAAAFHNIETEADVHNRIAEMLIEEDIAKQIQVNQLNDRKLDLLSQLKEIDGSLNLVDPVPEKTAEQKKAEETAAKEAAAKQKTADEAACKKDAKALDCPTSEAALKVAAAACAKDATKCPPAGGHTLLWVLIAVGVVGVGAGAFFFMRSKKNDAEGGEADAYTKFLDEELA